VLGLSFLLFSGVSGAAKGCPPRPDDAIEAKALAGEQFTRGTTLYKDRKYDAALAAFLCSLRSAEHENTVLNIAASLKNSPRKKAALEPLRAYVRDNPDTQSAAELRSLLRCAETFLKVPHVELPEPTVKEP
jgi:tetratricopeptide (TPR) repeat protein